MAGDWIKMSSDLRTNPKVVRIASALKADRFRVVGGLHAVWCLFDAHSEDGALDGYTLDALDELIGWPGFSAALVAVEWVLEGACGLYLPRFDNHNGQSAKRRAQETERKRMARVEPQMSAVDADKLRSREEKRREELTEAKASVRRGTKRCPVDFDPTPTDNSLSAPDWLVELAKFKDHEFARAKTDWPAAWRNWVREAFDRKQQRAPPTEGNYARQMREKYEQMSPMIAAKPPGAKRLNPMEILDGLTRSVDRPDLLEMQSGVRPGLREPMGGD